MLKTARGQLSIFFAMTMVLIISCLAIIINVGLFVKAKINLQNAVDAAAWSGAAVQARQLSNIAYLNWEMRNTYKEWMFKYYVLGQLSLPKNRPPIAGPVMDFYLNKFDAADPGGDFFNVPSTCIHFTGFNNICSIFTVPGIPRHNTEGLPGLDDQFNQALNQIVKTKAQNCSDRSDLNFMTATVWAYGSGDGTLILDGVPEIAAQRTGAWPEAIEYAIRMRNLEWMMNQPPRPTPVCAGGVGGCEDVRNLNSIGNPPGSFPMHERTIKAFWAAFRNLGNMEEPEMKNSFRMTELAPTPVVGPPQTMSTLLIPASFNDKHYVDLHLHILNLATFYTAFVNRTSTFGGSVPSQAECAATKIALPVPGYPFGFSKNPDVPTFYAIKGEAEFNGLLNPFSTPTTLVTYAAAKPFGGRIGPQLFEVDKTTNGQTVVARAGAQSRSFPYMSGIQTLGAYAPGNPVPVGPSFWVENPGEIIGGFPANPGVDPVKFAIPNLLYDIPASGDLSNQLGTSGQLQIIRQVNPPLPAEEGGLYDADQYTAFFNNLGLTAAGVVTSGDVDRGIINSRAPTRYEAMNYLIPTALDPNKADPNFDSVHPIVVTPEPGTGRNKYQLFAPLFGPELLYETVSDIDNAIDSIISASFPAIDSYVQALNDIAVQIRTDAAASAQQLYNQAANTVHSNPGSPLNPGCQSMAGKMLFFFKGGAPAQDTITDISGSAKPCNLVNLKDSIVNKINAEVSVANDGFQVFINPSYVHQSDSIHNYTNTQLMSAFNVGPRGGGNPDGTVTHPFVGVPDIVTHRNFYSTKLIPMQATMNGNQFSLIGGNGNFTVYSEGTDKMPADLNAAGPATFRNAIPQNELQEFFNSFLSVTH